MKKQELIYKITAPMSGRCVPITEVADPTFSDKILGDGVAIIPTDGKIVSPVDGTLQTVAETNHAFGFLSDDGFDILVHLGLETVALKGEGFKVYNLILAQYGGEYINIDEFSLHLPGYLFEKDCFPALLAKKKREFTKILKGLLSSSVEDDIL